MAIASAGCGAAAGCGVPQRPRQRHWQPPARRAAAPPSPARRGPCSRAGRAERRHQRLAKHDQRRLEIGYAGGRRNRSRRQRGLEKQPGFLEGVLDVAAGQVRIEAGPLRQHLHDRLLQFLRQAVRRRRRRRDWQTAAPGCPAGWPRSRPPADTATRSSGVSTFLEGAAAGGFAAASASASGASVTVSADAPARPAPCPTTASLMPSGVCDTASCRVWPAASGTSESTSIETFAIAIRTRLSARICEHLGVDHASRLQHEIGRRALGGNHRKDRSDGNRHEAISLGGETLAQRRKPLVNRAPDSGP